MEVERSTGRLLLLNSLRGQPGYFYDQDEKHAENDDSASSNDSLITMPPTTASLKTHTGHGHKKAGASGSSEAVTEGSRSRHHSGGHRSHRHTHHHRSRHHDLSPGITTPTPVQQSSEVSLTHPQNMLAVRFWRKSDNIVLMSSVPTKTSYPSLVFWPQKEHYIPVAFSAIR